MTTSLNMLPRTSTYDVTYGSLSHTVSACKPVDALSGGMSRPNREYLRLRELRKMLSLPSSLPLTLHHVLDVVLSRPEYQVVRIDVQRRVVGVPDNYALRDRPIEQFVGRSMRYVPLSVRPKSTVPISTDVACPQPQHSGRGRRAWHVLLESLSQRLRLRRMHSIYRPVTSHAVQVHPTELPNRSHLLTPINTAHRIRPWSTQFGHTALYPEASH